MISTIHLCQHLKNMLRVPINIFESDGVRVDFGYSDDNQKNPVPNDVSFTTQLLGMRNEELPVLHYEADCVVYAVIPANGDRTVIMGPACYDSNTENPSYAIALLHHIEHPDSYIVNYVDLTMFAESVLLVFHSHSNAELSVQELLLSSTAIEYRSAVRNEAYSIIYGHRENSTSHNSYAQEVREQKAVREGNVDALKKSWNEVETGNVGRLGKDDLSHFKSLAVVIITLASRSAIEGGIIPEVAFSLADTYTMKVNELTNPVEIARLARSAELHYTELVHEALGSGSENLYIRRCKELIHDRLNEKIYAEDLADELGITTSYLSQLFYKNEGLHLSEYILRQKVKSAEYLLIYPDIPLGNIAATFGFSSQSHFGQAFKRFKGITPGEYRRRHLQPGKSE